MKVRNAFLRHLSRMNCIRYYDDFICIEIKNYYDIDIG